MGFYYSPKIVTDGLVFYVDAANRKSYPGSGVDWNDLTKNGINSTLENSPSFSDDYIILDGGTKRVNLNYTTNNSDFVFEIILKVKSLSGTQVYVGKYAGGNDWWCGLNSGKIVFSINGNIMNSNLTAELDSVYHIVCENSNENGRRIFINGVLLNSTSYTSTNPTGNIKIGVFGDTNTFQSNIEVALFRYYDKSLSDIILSNNYNALKNRFGL